MRFRCIPMVSPHAHVAARTSRLSPSVPLLCDLWWRIPSLTHALDAPKLLLRIDAHVKTYPCCCQLGLWRLACRTTSSSSNESLAPSWLKNELSTSGCPCSMSLLGILDIASSDVAALGSAKPPAGTLSLLSMCWTVCAAGTSLLSTTGSWLGTALLSSVLVSGCCVAAASSFAWPSLLVTGTASSPNSCMGVPPKASAGSEASAGTGWPPDSASSLPRAMRAGLVVDVAGCPPARTSASSLVVVCVLAA